VNLLDLPAGAAVDAGKLPPAGKWLLVVGAHRLPPGYAALAATDGYELARAVPNGTLVGSALLGGTLPDGVVEAAHGLSLPEGSGRWSDGKYVRIRLARPLPRHGVVVLDAAAFGPNSKLPFTLRAGGASSTFRVGGGMRQVVVCIETDGDTRDLEIEVPQPISPHALGQSADQRALGIRLARIDVLADQLSVSSR
jgi:phosphoglycerol transferase